MKTRLFALLASVAMLAIPASSPAQRHRAPVAQRDWSQTAVRTPEGGIRIDNLAVSGPGRQSAKRTLDAPKCAPYTSCNLDASHLVE